jgi:hypothetical protein
MKLNYDKLLRLFLIAISIHSFLVGLGLIFATNSIQVLFGFYPSQEHFFQIQGGVFHIVMAFGYLMPAYDLKRFDSLVVFTIIVKLFATIFLFLYFILGSSNWLIFVSGLVDFLMSLIVFYLYKKYSEVSFNLGTRI